MAEDKISVALELDTSYYDKQMDQASDKFGKFAEEFKNPFKLDVEMGEDVLDKAVSEIMSSMEAIGQEMQSIQDRITEKQAKLAETTKKYQEIAGKWGEQFASENSGYGSEMEHQKKSIDVDTNSLEEAKQKMEALQSALDTLSKYKLGDSLDLGGILPKTEQAVNNFKGIRDWSEIAKSSIKGIGNVLSKLPGLAYNALKGMKSIGDTVRGYVVKAFNPLLKTIGRIGQSIKRQIVTTIASAINPLNLFRQSFSYLTDVLSPRLGATFKNIGNNLMEYIGNSPAFKALINDVLYFIKLLEIAWNKLASFLGIGKIDLFKTSAKSAKEMEKSAKGASKALAGFDEINNLAQGGGGGGSDSTPLSAGELFDGKDLDLSIFDYINEKVYALRDTLESIDFYSVGETIADGINSFVLKIDWGAITNTVSKGVQGLLKTITGLFNKLDFKGIGKKISDVFANLELGNIGANLSEAAISIYEGLAELLANIDWQELGNQIAEFFLSIDWWGILVAWFEFISELLFSIGELLWGIIQPIAQTLIDNLSNWFKSTPFGQAVISMVNTIVSTIKTIWDTLKPFFEGLWNAIVGVAKPILDTLGELFKTTWENIKIVWDVVVEYFKTIWTMIENIFSVVKAVLSGDFDSAWEAIKNIWNAVGGFFKKVWDGIKSIFGNVKDFFSTAFGNAWEAIKGIFSGVGEFFQGIHDGIIGILNGIIGTFEGLVNKIISGLNSFIKAINKIQFDVPDWVPVIGGQKWGFNFKTINDVSIPRLDTGTNYVPFDTFAMIHQGEAVIPKEFNKEEFFGKGNDETNELLQELIERVEEIEINPYTTIEDVGRASVDYINSQKRSLGRSVV